MNSLISKITLYDIISMLIPGSIVMIALIAIIPVEISEMYAISDNIILNSIAFIIISYAIGWCVSELGKLIELTKNRILKKESLQSKDNLKCNNLCILALTIIFIVTILCFTILLCYVLSIQNTTDFVIINYVIAFVLPIVVAVVIHWLWKDKVQHEAYDKVLTDACNASLKDYLGDYMGNYSSKDLFQICYALIQTDPRYGRIHNYSSSKSVSKNLATVCILLYIIFNIAFIASYSISNFNFSLSMCGVNTALFIAHRCLMHRYHFFKDELDIFAATYFIDYMKSNHKSSDELNESIITAKSKSCKCCTSQDNANNCSKKQGEQDGR